MTYNKKTHKYEPDGEPEHCQCVMGHSDMEEGAIEQCRRLRIPTSNLFCKDCEDLHGDYWRSRHPEP